MADGVAEEGRHFKHFCSMVATDSAYTLLMSTLGQASSKRNQSSSAATNVEDNMRCWSTEGVED